MRAVREQTCLSALSLDRIVADGQPGDDAQRHLDGCARCAERLEQLRTEAGAARPTVVRLLSAAAAQVDADASEQNAWRPRNFRFAAVAATACLALAGLWTFQRTEPTLSAPPKQSVRAKGTSVRLFVRRDGVVRSGLDVEGFRAGDELRFSTTNTAASFFILVGIGQESGRVTTYHPFQGEGSTELPPGTDVPLPGSLVLDESPETELYLAAFTDEPLSARDVKNALEKAHAQGARTLSEYESLELPGSQHWFEIRRQ